MQTDRTEMNNLADAQPDRAKNPIREVGRLGEARGRVAARGVAREAAGEVGCGDAWTIPRTLTCATAGLPSSGVGIELFGRQETRS